MVEWLAFVLAIYAIIRPSRCTWWLAPHRWTSRWVGRRNGLWAYDCSRCGRPHAERWR